MVQSFSFTDFLKTPFEFFGPYPSNADLPHRTLEYKDGCGGPPCEVDVFTPPGVQKVFFLTLSEPLHLLPTLEP